MLHTFTTTFSYRNLLARLSIIHKFKMTSITFFRTLSYYNSLAYFNYISRYLFSKATNKANTLGYWFSKKILDWLLVAILLRISKL